MCAGRVAGRCGMEPGLFNDPPGDGRSPSVGSVAPPAAGRRKPESRSGFPTGRAAGETGRLSAGGAAGRETGIEGSVAALPPGAGAGRATGRVTEDGKLETGARAGIEGRAMGMGAGRAAICPPPTRPPPPRPPRAGSGCCSAQPARRIRRRVVKRFIGSLFRESLIEFADCADAWEWGHQALSGSVKSARSADRSGLMDPSVAQRRLTHGFMRLISTGSMLGISSPSISRSADDQVHLSSPT